MAGSEQHPTDDVEGHTARANRLDAEAIDEDQAGDDTEGHSGHARV
jgi:hypothetical protein